MPENTLFNSALSRAMALCSQREYCSSDIRSKLQSWGAGENDIEKIIHLLIEEKFLNEERFAQAFVRDKFNFNKWGKLKISSHLKSKNVPPDIIRSALKSIDNEIYKKAIIDMISDHRRSVKAKNQYDLKAKLLRFGLSRGFESSLLYDLLNDIEE